MNLGLKYEESRVMYEETNNLMEKLSEIVELMVVGVCLPGFVIPRIIVSYFKYFTTDLGDDAFDLSIPMWSVFKLKWSVNII